MSFHNHVNRKHTNWYRRQLSHLEGFCKFQFHVHILLNVRYSVACKENSWGHSHQSVSRMGFNKHLQPLAGTPHGNAYWDQTKCLFLFLGVPSRHLLLIWCRMKGQCLLLFHIFFERFYVNISTILNKLLLYAE